MMVAVVMVRKCDIRLRMTNKFIKKSVADVSTKYGNFFRVVLAATKTVLWE